MTRLLMLLSVLVLISLVAPATHAYPVAKSAATCSDYANQRDAERHHDTRDPDHDGIFCEDLPCPCLKPGQDTAPSTAPKPTKPRKVSPGRSIAFGPLTTSGCRVRGPLPDPDCTPGARFAHATRRMICRPGYTAEVRDVSDALKERVYREYGIRHHSRSTHEVDHLVPLELGGSNSIANLFPEAARPKPGFHEKDRLENRLHDEMCAGERGLRTAQRTIATNWLAAYRAEF